MNVLIGENFTLTIDDNGFSLAKKKETDEEIESFLCIPISESNTIQYYEWYLKTIQENLRKITARFKPKEVDSAIFEIAEAIKQLHKSK